MSQVSIDFRVLANQANSQLQNLNKNVKAVSEQVTTSKLAFANLASAAVIGGIKAVGSAISFLTSSMAENIKLAQIQEDAVNALNVALKGAGKFSEAASRDLQEFASELQTMSIYGDEAILQAQALGIQMAKLGGEDLKKATQAAADMASALNIDLNTAMRLIAKSATDGGSGLGRWNIAVEKGSTSSQTLANAIEAVNRHFGGTAAGKAKTYSGAVIQLEGAFGDFREELGKIITKSPAIVKMLNKATELFRDLSDYVIENRADLQSWVKDGVLVAIEASEALVKSLNPVISAFKFTVAVFSYLTNAVKAMFYGLMTSITAIVASKIKALTQPIIELNKMFDSLVPDVLLDKVIAIREAYAEATAGMANDTTRASEAVVEAFNDIGSAFENTVSEDKIQLIRDRLKQVEKEVRKSNDKNKKDNKKTDNEDITNKKSFYDTWKGYVTNFKDFIKFSNEQRVENMKSTLGTISTLTSSSNKTLFAIGKAAAISTATIDGIAAVQKAWASAPFPANIAIAALVGVATAANIAKIASTKPPQFQDGGIVPGVSTFGDRTPALVNSGEMILNRSQQTQLFDIANGSSANNNGNLVEAINNLGDRIANMEIVLQADDIEIGRSVNRALDSGFVLASN